MNELSTSKQVYSEGYGKLVNNLNIGIGYSRSLNPVKNVTTGQIIQKSQINMKKDFQQPSQSNPTKRYAGSELKNTRLSQDG
jgi:hypothetical protein